MAGADGMRERAGWEDMKKIFLRVISKGSENMCACLMMVWEADRSVVTG